MYLLNWAIVNCKQNKVLYKSKLVICFPKTSRRDFVYTSNKSVLILSLERNSKSQTHYTSWPRYSSTGKRTLKGSPKTAQLTHKWKAAHTENVDSSNMITSRNLKTYPTSGKPTLVAPTSHKKYLAAHLPVHWKPESVTPWSNELQNVVASSPPTRIEFAIYHTWSASHRVSVYYLFWCFFSGHDFWKRANVWKWTLNERENKRCTEWIHLKEFYVYCCFYSYYFRKHNYLYICIFEWCYKKNYSLSASDIM